MTAGLEEKVHLIGFVGSGRFEGEGASVGLASIRTLGGGVNGRAVQVKLCSRSGSYGLVLSPSAFCVHQTGVGSPVGPVDPTTRAARLLAIMTTAVLTDLQLRIEKLTPAEKVELMEVLWRDMRKDEAAYETPAWHSQALDDAERLVAEDGAKFSDWDEARDRLQKRIRRQP